MGRARGRGTGRTIDYKQWSFIPAIELSSAAAATISGASLAFEEPATILRCRGELVVALDGVAAGASNGVTFGLGIVSTDAATLGATALPDPGAEPNFPWLWWHDAELISNAVEANEQSDITSAVRVPIDTKAMRKMKPGESLIMVVQTDSAITVDILLSRIRVLIGT